MEEKILTGLKDLGYEGPLLQKGNLKTSIEYGSKNIEYTKLVHYLTSQIGTLSNLDEKVNPISGPEDCNSFLMEMSSFLKELNCPYQSLTQGHVSDRLQNLEDRQLLLDYLISELMIARINQEKKPAKKIELKLQETPEAADLRQILITLGFPKPPADITVRKLFQNLQSTVEDLIKKVGDELIGKAFFSGFLSEKQWQTLSDLQRDLNNEYKIRREMLLTRLDVTIQSFQWSERSRGKDDFFETAYKTKRNQLDTEPDVDISHLLAARSDVAIIEKTSNSSVRKNTSTSLHKVIIGQVPDRGGRTNELAPPPPEMPSWQQRTPGPQGGGRGGFNRGGGQQNYSRGGGQSSFGRGNNSFGNANRENMNTYSGFKSSFSLGSDKKPFSNFDTSLSLSGSSSYKSNFTSSYTGNRRSYDDKQSSGYRDSYSSYNKGGSPKPFDSAGSYDSPNKRPRTNYENSNKGYSNSGTYSQKRSFDIPGDNQDRGNYSSRTNSGNYGGDSRSNYTAYDSAGSYDTNKRAKSYNDFQTSNSTYSDQYVKDSQSNQQYHSRNESSRGRSNYHRGQGNRYK